jgi:hypothetical protein
LSPSNGAVKPQQGKLCRHQMGDIILLLVARIQFSKRIAADYEVPFPFFSHAAHYGAITSYIMPLFMLFRHVSLLEIEMQICNRSEKFVDAHSVGFAL